MDTDECRARRHLHLAHQHEPAEDKSWSYGARSSLADARGPRPWLLSAPVQDRPDRRLDARDPARSWTSTSAIARPRPRRSPRSHRDVRALSGRYETNAAVGGAIAEVVTFNWPTTTCVRSRSASRRRATRACGRGAAGDRPVARHLGGDRRPHEDRAARARPAAGRGTGARRRRQGAALSTASAATPTRPGTVRTRRHRCRRAAARCAR